VSGQGAGTQYAIDPDTLRAVALDPAAMLQHADELLAHTETTANQTVAARARSSAAIWFAIAGDVDQAHAQALLALSFQRTQHSLPDITVTEIRFAQILQLRGKLDAADALLTQAVARCRTNSAVANSLDFALQHLGKVQFERRQSAQALQTFGEALVLREAKDEADLIESTRLAIEAVRRHMRVAER
jgi:tetratricopeptide (TPR) repeat protein